MTDYDQLLPPDPQVTQVNLWGTVTGRSPLRVQLDTPGPLNITPDTLIDAGALAVGDRVWCQLTTNNNTARKSQRLVIIGRSGGNPTPDLSFTPALLGATTNPTLGSGPIVAGRYWRDASTGRVWGDGLIIFGTSGVAAGSGIYSVTLPTEVRGFQSGSTGQADIWGWWSARDTSNTAASRHGILSRNTPNAGPGGVGVADLALLDGTQAFARDSVPWIWAASDGIAYKFDYMSPL